MRRIPLIMILMLALAACRGGDREPDALQDGGLAEVGFRILAAGGLGTRSSIGAAEDRIDNLLVLFYEDGRLLPELTVSLSAIGADNVAVGVSLGIGHSFDVVSFANCTVTPAPQTLAEARALCYGCDGCSGWSQGIPMAGYKSVKVSYRMPDVEMQLVRLAARLDLTIDTSSLQHGSISFTSVAVRQMNRSCPFFGTGCATASSGVCDGDCASADDLASINASGPYCSATFYLLENMQGNLLEGNSDPDRKTPSVLSARGYDPGLCTYLEIRGTYSDLSGHMTSDSLVSHLYLGSDALGNFDLERNHRYGLSVTISDNGCLRTDWKINGYLDDRRRLAFVSPELEVRRDGIVTAELDTNISLDQGDYSYSLSGNAGSFTVTPSADGFLVTPKASATDGQYVDISVVSWDGALRSDCRVRFVEPRFIVEWTNNLYIAQKGTIRITDRLGQSLGGYLQVYPTGYCSRVDGYADTWVVSAVAPGWDELTIAYDHEVMGYIRVDVLQPVLSFVSDKIPLPLDGSRVEAGPFFYRQDGSRLYYEDFDPDLFAELLNVSVTRYQDGYQGGRYWGAHYSAGNPVVGCSNIGTGCVDYEFYLDSLSYGGHSIYENYKLYEGDADLEYIHADATGSIYFSLSADAILCVRAPG